MSSNNNLCSICLENLTDNNLSITKCNHKFHLTCLIESFKFSNKCPLCREILFENNNTNHQTNNSTTQTEFPTIYNHVTHTYLLQE
jgi:hypothetical protein